MRTSIFLRLLAITSLACFCLQAQVTSLSFRPVDAKYSTPLDRIIFASASPNQLHNYNAASQSDQVVSLAEAPLNLSLSPDGTHAAVAFADAVAYIDLQAGTVVQTFSGLTVGTEQVVIGNGYIYLLPNKGNGNVTSINMSSGTATAIGSEYGAGSVFDPLTKGVYTTSYDSAAQILHYDASGGAIPLYQNPTSSGRFGAPSACGQLVPSRDGSLIYTGCGTIFTASTDPTKDLIYVHSLPGLTNTSEFVVTIQAIATSDALHQVAAIPQPPIAPATLQPLADTVVDLFSTTSLNPAGQFATTPFSVGGTNYPAHGRWVFYNAASSAMYIVTQADSTANLSIDYALETVNLTNSNSCGATFASSTGNANAPGGYLSAQISASQHCVFTAASNTSWIVLSSGYYGSGNTTLTYLVRPNPSSSARSGSISLGTQTLTVTQPGAGASPNPTPLSFKPVAADYAKALDKVVMVSAAPNELHVYDPLSQSDQIVALPFIPTSLSVSRDGLRAGVGHDGWFSYVDLQAFTVLSTISIPAPITAVTVAANGYAYAFNTQAGDSSAIQLSNGTVTSFTSVGAFIARLHPSGTAIYLSSGPFSQQGYRLDISTNPSAPTYASSGPVWGGNFWLSEDGARMITSAGYSLFTSSVPSQDFGADGNLSASDYVGWAAESQIQHVTAVLEGDAITPATATNTQLEIYSDNGLQLQSQIPMPSFTVNGQNYISHGRYVFWNAAETKLFVFTEADSTSGLLSDFAEYTVSSLQSIPACSYSVSPTTLDFAPAAAPYYSFSSFVVNVTSNCNWTYSAQNENWFSAFSTTGDPVTIGSGQLTVTPTTNTGGARSATISVGNTTVTVNQAASTCTYTLSSDAKLFPLTGGSVSFTLTTDVSCLWSLQSNQPWLAVSPQSGQGSATITVTAAPSSPPSGYQYAVVNVAGSSEFFVTEQESTSPPLNFVPVTPCRVADTRNPNGTFGGPYVPANGIRTLPIPNSACNIPLYSAFAYSLNVTVVPHHGLSYLTAWPTGVSQPPVSLLNSDGRVKAVAAIVPAGTDGSVNFYATDDTELIVDINGYFEPYTISDYWFYPVTPCRIADTRNANSTFGGPGFTATETRAFPVLSSACNTPSAAKAYSLNFTAVPENQGIGYLSTWPTGQSQPVVSTLNDPTVTVVANAAIVPVGASGGINVYSSDITHLVVDTNGYFAPYSTGGAGGLNFYTVTPCRVLDTRVNWNRQPLAGTMTVQMAGNCNIPSGAAAVVVNATVVPVTSLGYLSLWPTGTAQPLVSTLNADDEVITSNMAIVPLGSGAINAYSSSGTHLILDVSGYFAPY